MYLLEKAILPHIFVFEYTFLIHIFVLPIDHMGQGF